MSETVIRSRIDSNIKLEAQSLLERFGLTMSDAIRLSASGSDRKGAAFSSKTAKGGSAGA